MINNNFICELNIDLDIKKLTEVSLDEKRNTDIKAHQRFAKDYEYMDYIKSKFPILGEMFNVYYFLPYRGIDPHIDAARLCSLNIPLAGTENSLTKFYHPVEDMQTLYYEKGILNYVTTPLKIAFEFSLIKPTLIRTDIPHSVSAANVNRLVISWGIHELDFFEAKKYFLSSEYVVN